MIATDLEIDNRIKSPGNLMNMLSSLRERSRTTPSMIVSIPPPTAKDIIPDLDDKLALNGARAKALSIIDKCMDRLNDNIDLMPVKVLGTTAKQMADTIKAFEEKSEQKNIAPVQFHIYTPEVRSINEFETIVVKE